jgi:hypothetical protein
MNCKQLCHHGIPMSASRSYADHAKDRITHPNFSKAIRVMTILKEGRKVALYMGGFLSASRSPRNSCQRPSSLPYRLPSP